MAFNGMGGEISIRKRLPDEILSTQTPAVEAKKQVKKPEVPQEPLPKVRPAEFLSKNETRQVLERFQPLPALLNKALQGNQGLRREIQATVQLTQAAPAGSTSAPRAEQGPPAIGAQNPAGKENFPGNVTVPRKVPVPPNLERSQEAPPPTAVTHPIPLGIPNQSSQPPHSGTGTQGPGLAMSLTPPPRAPQSPNLRPREPQPHTTEEVDSRSSLTTVNVNQGNGKQPPPINEKTQVQLGSPTLISEPHENPPTLPITEKVPPARLSEQREVIIPGGGLSRPNTAPLTPQNQVVEPPTQVQAVRGSLRVNRPPLGGVMGSTTHALETNRNIAPTTLQPKSATGSTLGPAAGGKVEISPAQHIQNLSPRPSLETTQAVQTATSSSFLSVASTNMPMVTTHGDNLHLTSRGSREDAFWALQRRLRESGSQNLVIQARQAVQLQQVHPLTTPVSTVAQANTLPPATPQPIRQVFKTETVAPTPVHEDNMARTLEVRPTGFTRPESVIPGGIRQTPVNAPPPPLANLNPPPRPLPTDLRSRLVQAPAVNLLDLVL